MAEQCTIKEDCKDGGSIHGKGELIEIKEIEIGHIDLRYAHTRMHRPEDVSSLVASIQSCAQLNPVITVKEGDLCFVLIDGYLRVSALKRCGRDTVLAEIWPCKEVEALIRVLMRTQERRWEALEQALMIRELRLGHNLSQAKIAHLMGRNQSWVSRRLSLLDALSEDIVELVQKGRISTWAAVRVLAPMARAIPEHARRVKESLAKEHISTRQLTVFFHHYQKANRKQRDKMVLQPLLFLKALRAKEEEEQARSLKEGPEGGWLKDLKVIGHILRRLIEELPTVIYKSQSNLDRRRLLTAFEDTKGLLLTLDQEIRRFETHDITRDKTKHFGIASEGDQDPTDHSDAQDLQKHCASCSAGGEEKSTPKNLRSRGTDAHHPGFIQILPG